MPRTARVHPFSAVGRGTSAVPRMDALSEAQPAASTTAVASVGATMKLMRLGGNTSTVKTILPKKFVVAIDGSKLGFRAAKLAACFCDVRAGDKVKMVIVRTGKLDATQANALLKNAETMLKEGCFPQMNIDRAEVLEIQAGKSLAETLCSAAAADKGGMLVMGAGGMRLEEEWKLKKKTTPAAMTGSVALECMAKCKVPVIITKPKAYGVLEREDFFNRRRDPGSIGAMSVVAAVTDPNSSAGANKTLDMAVKLHNPKDKVALLNIKTTSYTESTKTYWTSEAAKQGPAYTFHLEAPGKSPIDKAIVEFCDKDEILADLIILNSAELVKPHGHALGSVSIAVAKSTEANVLIAKHFAN